MALADPIVAEARRWIGTPFVHGASVNGAGCDCLGLIRGVRAALGGACPDRCPPYARDWALRGGDEILHVALTAHLRRVPPAQPDRPGQVVLFRLRPGAPASHLGILTDLGVKAAHPRRFVHAYGRFGVIESPMGEAWARRIVARFDLI